MYYLRTSGSQMFNSLAVFNRLKWLSFRSIRNHCRPHFYSRARTSSVQPPKWSRPRNDPQPWNDPQNDPHFPSWRPRNDPQGIREWGLNMGLWIAFLFFVEILQSCHFFLFLVVGSLSRSSLAPVSFQSRSSRPLTHLVWCNVSNRVVFSSSSVLCFTNRYFGKWC